MNRATLILGRLSQLDPRSDDELARDLEDEFAFHLDQLERELRESGESPADASRKARERFGDVEAIRRQCATIARKEHVIMMKILTAVLGLTTLIVLIACLMLYQEAQHAHREAVESRMVAEQARVEAEQEARRAQAVQSFLVQHLAAIDPSTAGGRPEVGELLDSAAERADATFYDQPEVRAKIREGIEKAREEARPKSADEARLEQADRDLSGVWRQIVGSDEDSSRVTLRIVSIDDPTNVNGIPISRLQHSLFDERVELGFCVGRTDPNRLIITVGGQPVRNGRWWLEGDRLLIDLSPAAPDETALREPLIFEKMADEGTGASGSGTGDSDE
jgi:hypothetical protein